MVKNGLKWVKFVLLSRIMLCRDNALFLTLFFENGHFFSSNIRHYWCNFGRHYLSNFQITGLYPHGRRFPCFSNFIQKCQGSPTSPLAADVLCCPWCLCWIGVVWEVAPTCWGERGFFWQVKFYFSQFELWFLMHRLMKVLIGPPIKSSWVSLIKCGDKKSCHLVETIINVENQKLLSNVHVQLFMSCLILGGHNDSASFSVSTLLSIFKDDLFCHL